ncbi:SRPBCC family protein [Streptomyces sp. H10-C2]|uniref:SRPBCC family protein n=1 Tax=unclassified Streptomyces TaxID=2593676 RepID=UPI0024B931FF|nr:MULTISPECIES: SRPBCC family protein [unclassified Streptomyces]MDJ0347442.1 SRPBCC family protein [Streptomyces sp. PH10-H1]MDJ0375676.1 SRPBCC family protein [Streptomyces sp. H10-C2]
MSVYNVHERLLAAKESEVGALIDTLSSGGDALWPRGAWHPMEFDRPLAVGAVGGHGPVRYTVAAYVPSTWVRFAFGGPRGFHGFHEYAVLAVDEERALLRHTLAMNVRGPARLTWPLAFRSLHDACLEDSLDRAELACTGAVARPARWGVYARLLRGLVR